MSTHPSVSDARLLSVLSTAVDGIVVMDDRARILLFNQACEKLFGYTAEETFGQNVKMLMPEEYARAHDGYLRHYLETGERRIIGIGREVRGRHRDGTEFPIELSVGEAHTAEGRQFIGIIRDLRPRKAVEKRLAQAQNQLISMTRISALDEMGAAISHELNQPLTAIMLYLQAIRRKAQAVPELDASLAAVIDKALKESERASQIIQRMRHFVEKKEPERRPVDVAELIDECMELVTLGNANVDVPVESDVADDLPRLHVDPVQIQQVLVNLLRNALEAVRTVDERWVRISAARDDGAIVITVADSGPGVPAEIVPNLFRAFSGSKRRGLGLGLAISRSIAQNHGGDLTVEHDSGAGARFVLQLPLTNLDDAIGPQSASDAGGKGEKGTTA